MQLISLAGSWIALALFAQEREGDGRKALLEALKTYEPKLLFETYRGNNWEIYLVNADGSEPVNLTNTPDVDELYPKASPDGTKIAFVADEKSRGKKSRNLYYMNSDGTGRTKLAENVRDPCWSPDGKAIAYLKGEMSYYTVMIFATKGLHIYDLETRKHRPHPNRKIEHLFTLDWSRDGKWFVSTVHGGMGFRHSIIAIEAEGKRVVDLKLPGCRADVRFDGKRVVWGHGDFALGLADLDLPATRTASIRKHVRSPKPVMTYHADWSPDGKFIAFTRGPKFEGKRLSGATRETPGVKAPGWDLCVADASRDNTWVQITRDGLSNKEPDWVIVPRKPGR